MLFGDRLKELRKSKGITQAELAKKLKLSASTIGMYEQNRRDPDTQTVSLIAEILNVSVNELIGVDIVSSKILHTPLKELNHKYGTDSKGYSDFNVFEVSNTKKQELQKDNFIKQASALFMDASEEDRDMLYRSLSEIYFESKAKNREKYNPNKNKKK